MSDAQAARHQDGAPSAVIVVSSHVARGAVGGRAAVPALQAFGLSVWSVPTVILPWHPGHGRATRIVPPADAFAALAADLAGSPWTSHVAAVLSGYLGDAAQAAPVAALVEAVKKANPRALYLCDPVLGDETGLYVPETTAAAIRDRLLPLADIATPNRFELEWLAGRPLTDNVEATAAARAVGPDRVLVTTAHSGAAASVSTLLVTPVRTLLTETVRLEDPPKGTGDLAAALFLAHLLAGESDEPALAKTTAAVHEALLRSTGRDELVLEGDTACLVAPETVIDVKHVPAPDGGQT